MGDDEAMVLASDFKRGVDARRVMSFEDDGEAGMATIVGESCWEESGGSVSRRRFLSEWGVA